MAFSSLFLLLSRRPKPLLSSLACARSMGGGPRTFPGGLNKWQYKRMHEKLAKEKERKLIQQEKQLYQARLRFEIRAKIATGQSPLSDDSPSASNFTAMSSKDHIKALADRFMKAGAEDLWNEDDGPIRETKPKQNSTSAPFDPRKVGKEGMNLVGKLGSFAQKREYSKWRSDLSSDDENGDYGGGVGGLIRKELKMSRFARGESEEAVGEERGFVGGRKKMMSGAALRNHDVKREKRRAPVVDDEEDDLSEKIQSFREEIRSREFIRGDRNGFLVKQDSVLTHKRFDECSISPNTIKALNSCGYVQMTVVQEAALPVCLEGKDALVKARTGTGKSAAFLF